MLFFASTVPPLTWVSIWLFIEPSVDLAAHNFVSIYWTRALLFICVIWESAVLAYTIRAKASGVVRGLTLSVSCGFLIWSIYWMYRILL